MKKFALYIVFLSIYSYNYAQPYIDIAGLQFMKNSDDELLNENKVYEAWQVLLASENIM